MYGEPLLVAESVGCSGHSSQVFLHVGEFFHPPPLQVRAGVGMGNMLVDRCLDGFHDVVSVLLEFWNRG